MTRRYWIGAVIAGATLVGAAFSANSFEPRTVSVTARGEPTVEDAQTTTSAAAEAPVDTDLRQKLRCPPVPADREAIPGVFFNTPAAYSGYPTPEAALEDELRYRWPRAPRNFQLTGRNSVLARFENGQAIFLATLLQDGYWYVTQGNTCWDVDWSPENR